MILELHHISKSYPKPGSGSIHVLKNISFSLDRGDTMAITGQSGSGKTTLLSLIAGLDRPDFGQILLEGKDISAMKENELSQYRALKTSIIFQQFHLMPHLTAEENISLPLEILKQDRIKELTDEMLEKTGLKDRRHHLPGALSGGECQRVAIARALIIKPALLLADEPTGNLDMETGEKIAKLLFDLVEKENKTLILVTHNPFLAGQCREIRRLEKGVLV
ncbi:MAG: ABC transporter ATP-binding protein [Desulfobacula sp. RIFOXYB2_FULL_45_6]|nr:MAG: ABC transporter ATP-binding protein [Desulfobacula sp. GWF2_41_7]OGR22757.1 MAG: ABC transporter ATP-binding protein [Desulfobacterales bacterium RIFOXYA12_FULL_46_15]OGR31812.1 MAG: ABC transporter ATP-binding protein [Desulfobacula sp. RIFOXYB2_FULL_45_6]